MSTPAEPAATTPVGAEASGGGHLRGEIRALTGLRAVAALWVVFFHFRFTPGDAYTPYWQWLRPVVISGEYGVDLFYVLSGFVITLTYADRMGSGPFGGGARRWGRTTASFLWNRICRIWPVYATVTVLFLGWLLYK
nr:acyltransferase [Actinomycetota bacterium]